MQNILAENAPVKLETKSEEPGNAILRQLWKIRYLGDGYYGIRALYKPDRCLKATSNAAKLHVVDTFDHISYFDDNALWKIEALGTGYTLQNCGVTTSKQCLRPSGTDVVTSMFISGNGAFTWTLTPDTSVPDMLLLIDTRTALPAEDKPKFLIYNNEVMLEDIYILPSLISLSSNDQSYTISCSNSSVLSVDNNNKTIMGTASGRTYVYISGFGGGSTGTIRMNVIGQDQYSAGVRVATVDGVRYYDFTLPFHYLMDETLYDFYMHRCYNYADYAAAMAPLIPTALDVLEMQVSAAVWFYIKVHSGGVWDIKVEESWRATLPGIPYLTDVGRFVFRGKLLSTADMGNLFYGYMGRAIGFGETTLYWGGGVAAKGLRHPDTKIAPLYGDAPEDHFYIEQGYLLFLADHPDCHDIGFDGVPTDDLWYDELEAIFGG